LARTGIGKKQSSSRPIDGQSHRLFDHDRFRSSSKQPTQSIVESTRDEKMPQRPKAANRKAIDRRDHAVIIGQNVSYYLSVMPFSPTQACRATIDSCLPTVVPANAGPITTGERFEQGCDSSHASQYAPVVMGRRLREDDAKCAAAQRSS
jgi:hypothetical protein